MIVFVIVRTSFAFFSSGVAALETESVVEVTGVSEVAGAEGTISFSFVSFSFVSSKYGASSFITFTSSVVSS